MHNAYVTNMLLEQLHSNMLLEHVGLKNITPDGVIILGQNLTEADNVCCSIFPILPLDIAVSG